jgi:hypothetical protein
MRALRALRRARFVVLSDKQQARVWVFKRKIALVVALRVSQALFAHAAFVVSGEPPFIAHVAACVAALGHAEICEGFIVPTNIALLHLMQHLLPSYEMAPFLMPLDRDTERSPRTQVLAVIAQR